MNVGLAQDVAGLVCQHLEKHRFGQLDTKVILESRIETAVQEKQWVEAIPFYSNKKGSMVHWCVIRPLPIPDNCVNNRESPALLQTVCYTTQSAAKEMCVVFLGKNPIAGPYAIFCAEAQIVLNVHIPGVDMSGQKGIIESFVCTRHVWHGTDLGKKIHIQTWETILNTALQKCERQSIHTPETA